MKKPMRFGLFLLPLLLLFFILPGAFAAEAEDVFTVNPTEGIPHQGYLVYVREGAPSALSLLRADVDFKAVADNLYQLDCIEEIAQIWQADEIVYIEPNYEITLLSTPPNDALFHLQWDMAFINAQALWGSGITGEGVRIAVLDSGIVQNHEDINYYNVHQGRNYITGTRNVTDTMGHGTEVIGVIAAVRNNHVGVAGLLDQVQIIPLKVFEQGQGSLSHAIRAIYDAVDVFQADVINMSWAITGGGQSRSLENAINHAASRNVILVAAAGNNGNSTYVYPASYANVIGVGAVDRHGNVATFSQRNTSVFVTAPGDGIVTLGHRSRTNYNVHPTSRGTSIAAPYVSAMAAVARSVRHDMTASEFRELLRRSAVPRGPVGYNVYYGHGTIDFHRFIQILPETNWILGFRDITGHWAVDSIRHCVERGLFTGTTSYAFSPEQSMNRAMLVTALGRLYEQMGGHVPVRNDHFIDTQRNSWYSRYVAWAVEHNIVQGVGGGRFDPYARASRQQTAVLFYNFARYAGLDTNVGSASLDGFIDRGSAADWAEDALIWAVERGLVTGISTPNGMMLQPGDFSTRAQVAVILVRYINLAEQSLAQVA